MSVFDGLPDIFTGAFGQPVTLRNASAQTVEIEAIFQHRTEIGLDVATRTPTIHVREVDWVDMEEYADCLVTVDGTNYRPRNAEPDGKGMVMVELELDGGADDY